MQANIWEMQYLGYIGCGYVAGLTKEKWMNLLAAPIPIFPKQIQICSNILRGVAQYGNWYCTVGCKSSRWKEIHLRIRRSLT